MDLLDKAICFCRAGHSAVGQKRKYTGEDYYHHPEEVALLVHETLGKKCTQEMIVAALCHDLAEDTGITLEFIRLNLSEEVAILVEMLTDISKPEDGNRAKRKEIDREHTAKASPAAKTIKLADLISNSKSICEHDKDFAKVYIKEKELLLEVLTEGDPTLYAQAKDIVENAKKELGIE